MTIFEFNTKTFDALHQFKIRLPFLFRKMRIIRTSKPTKIIVSPSIFNFKNEHSSSILVSNPKIYSNIMRKSDCKFSYESMKQKINEDVESNYKIFAAKNYKKKYLNILVI